MATDAGVPVAQADAEPEPCQPFDMLPAKGNASEDSAGPAEAKGSEDSARVPVSEGKGSVDSSPEEPLSSSSCKMLPTVDNIEYVVLMSDLPQDVIKQRMAVANDVFKSHLRSQGFTILDPDTAAQISRLLFTDTQPLLNLFKHKFEAAAAEHQKDKSADESSGAVCAAGKGVDTADQAAAVDKSSDTAVSADGTAAQTGDASVAPDKPSAHAIFASLGAVYDELTKVKAQYRQLAEGCAKCLQCSHLIEQ